MTPPNHTKPYQTKPNQEKGGRKKYEEVVEKVRGQKIESPRVQRSQGWKVQGSQGPKYLKDIFRYKLDSKEGPSCFLLFYNITIKFWNCNILDLSNLHRCFTQFW